MKDVSSPSSIRTEFLVFTVFIIFLPFSNFCTFSRVLFVHCARVGHLLFRLYLFYLQHEESNGLYDNRFYYEIFLPHGIQVCTGYFCTNSD